jgi:hypothetical protein
MWADYLATATAIDKTMWPTQHIRGPSTILAFTQTGTRRWYLHMPSASVLLRAVEPAISVEVEHRLTEVIEHVIATQPEMFRPDQRWLTISVTGVSASPDGSGVWIPELALMETPPRHFEATRLQLPREDAEN